MDREEENLIICGIALKFVDDAFSSDTSNCETWRSKISSENSCLILKGKSKWNVDTFVAESGGFRLLKVFDQESEQTKGIVSYEKEIVFGEEK